MSIVTTNDLHNVSTDKGRQEAPRIFLAQSRSLDLLALSTLLLSTKSLNLIGSAISLQALVESCREHRPEVVIIDVTYPGGAAFDAAADLIENEYTQHVLLLDDAISACHLNQANAIPRTEYLTKEANLEYLCETIETLCASTLSLLKTGMRDARSP